jgi:hypothetical protein
MSREMTQRRCRNIDKTEVYALQIRGKYFLFVIRPRQNGYLVPVFRKRGGPVPPVPWLATETRTALERGE